MYCHNLVSVVVCHCHLLAFNILIFVSETNDHWMVPYNVYGFLFFIRRTQETPKGVKKDVSIYMGIDYLRNKSWKPECVLSFNMGWQVLVFYTEWELGQKRSKSGNFQNLKVFIFHPILKCSFFVKCSSLWVIDVMSQ